ncbi:hypothetical protein [Marinomonas sp. PE14-40]|uniref:hypothetical protein n=1 Tax=Marinomonas sp. PE14-40 TaxID=3060621 RepID=UPI003F66DDCA
MNFKVTVILCLLYSVNSIADDKPEIPHQMRDMFELRALNAESLKDIETKINSATIFTILANTQELHSHQMNGEIHNQVYLHKDGHKEAVFKFDIDDNGKAIDGTGSLVTDCINQASFNYYHPYEQPLGHFSVDTLPWLLWGNCRNDPSTKEQRVAAFIKDFSMGFERVISGKQGFYLPRNFSFSDSGQSETISFFLKALDTSGFEIASFLPKDIQNKEKQRLFISALEDGINILLKKHNKTNNTTP